MFSFLRSTLLVAAFAGSAMAASNASEAVTYDNMASTILEFQGANLVPQVIPDELMSLAGSLQVKFGNATAELGSIVPADQLTVAPTFIVNYTNAVSQQDIFWNELFTVVAFDAAYPGVETTNDTVWRQYLCNNMTALDGALHNMTGPVTSWKAPSIPQGSGPHRMVQLVFAQGPDFAPVANYTNTTGQAAANMSLTDYVKRSNLGKIVAANYFIVQNGTDVNPDIKVQATQAVPAESVQAKATSISASILADATRGARAFKTSTAAPFTLPSSAIALVTVSAVSVAAAFALLV